MIKQTQFIKLQEILSRVLRHPLLQSVTMEQAVQYCIDFIHIFGLPEMYIDKEVIVSIKKYRGELPCDLIKINQVKDVCSGKCFRSMTDTFFPDESYSHENNMIYAARTNELTFKVQNHVIFTSIENGDIKVSYKAIPVDEDGFPLIPDNPTYHKALELYIKVELFTILFDEGKIKSDVLQHTEQQYAWRAGQLTSEYNIPSEEEMQSLCNSWCTLIQRTTDFDSGWRHMGNREYIKRH